MISGDELRRQLVRAHRYAYHTGDNWTVTAPPILALLDTLLDAIVADLVAQGERDGARDAAAVLRGWIATRGGGAS